MFQSSKNRLRAWLTWTEDILGDESDEPLSPHPHPHRPPLRWERTRRPGTVPARPAHCISPTRAVSEGNELERTTR